MGACVCACCIANTIIRLFLRKLAKRANIFALPARAWLSCQGRLCIFHNVHEHVLDTLQHSRLPAAPPLYHDIPLLLHVSEFVSMYVSGVRGALCVVQNMRLRGRFPCIHQHVMRRQQLPLSTCPSSLHSAACSVLPALCCRLPVASWRVCSKCQ